MDESKFEFDYEESTIVTNPCKKIAIPIKDCCYTATAATTTATTATAATAVDFDEASRAWNLNKVRKGASYVYRCPVVNGEGIRCKNAPSKREGANGLCLTHFRLTQE